MPPPPPARSRRWLVIVALLGLFGAIVVVGGVTIVNRLETGRWTVPTTRDVVRMAKGRPRPASKTIFLERRPIALRPGADDAPRGTSSMLARPAKLPGWKGSDASWSQLVACVRARFAPFDVEITDERPLHADFVLVAVGGKPSDVGAKDKRAGGLAPFTGDVIPVPVVFAFAAALDHEARAVCDAIGTNVARVYGQRGFASKPLVSVLGAR